MLKIWDGTCRCSPSPFVHASIAPLALLLNFNIHNRWNGICRNNILQDSCQETVINMVAENRNVPYAVNLTINCNLNAMQIKLCTSIMSIRGARLSQHH